MASSLDADSAQDLEPAEAAQNVDSRQSPAPDKTADCDTPPEDILVELCTDGDVRIVCEQSPHWSYLVSSAFLSHASPVFRAMFCGQFAEAKDLSPSQPKTVRLDGSPPALEALLRFIHHRSEAMDIDPDPEDLYALAVVCDKYGCGDIFQFHVRYWFRTIPTEWTFRQTCYMMASAALFNLALPFRDLTKTLVLNYTESPAQICIENEDPSWIRPQAIYHLEKQRRAAVSCIRTALIGVQKARLPCECLYDPDGSGLGEALRLLLEDSLTIAISAGDNYIHKSTGACREHGKHNRKRVYGETNITSGIDKAVAGLCLQCYLKGAETMGTCAGIHDVKA